MIKGDILVFKKYLGNLLPDDIFGVLLDCHWQEGDICEYVELQLSTPPLFGIRNCRNKENYYWSDDYEEERSLYIYNWFYTISEWRDRQINLLNG